MEKTIRIPRGKGLGLGFFCVLVLLISFITFRFTEIAKGASGDITLTASAFSDPDGEDTQTDSQWVIRDAGSTVYDQTAGAVDTITVAAATFVNGTTYFWKVRYQDQHLVWGDYSDEGAFIYGSSEVPSPTPTPDTPTPSASGTATTTTTATPTPDTATVTPTPTPTPTPSCAFGWKLLNGLPFCGDGYDTPRNEIYVP